MFPKAVYELLPFIYMSIGLGGGLGSGLVFDSAMVMLASILLIITGLLVLSMRISYRRQFRRRR